ncbi:MAG: mediator of RNA polymerase II transcription subunit 8 [Cirrosporium novae-zelandiae]|nr:MAG: mediator of RNA polymerase II transcription subunit 8 [Cirrosporium novae-zelandiae]
MASLDPDEIKILEQTRQRLVQLTNSLASLQANILQNDLLPPWSSIHTQASIISQNLNNLSSHINDNRDLFESLVTYPLPEFPGRTQEGLLTQLLRKKLEPDVEDWENQGRETATKTTKKSDGKLSLDELMPLWQEAGRIANMEAKKRKWPSNYTREEQEMGIENVVTGLKRKLPFNDDEEEDESSEEEGIDEDEDEDPDRMEVVGMRRRSGAAGIELDVKQANPQPPRQPALALEVIFRFQLTGADPGN